MDKCSICGKNRIITKDISDVYWKSNIMLIHYKTKEIMGQGAICPDCRKLPLEDIIPKLKSCPYKKIKIVRC